MNEFASISSSIKRQQAKMEKQRKDLHGAGLRQFNAIYGGKKGGAKAGNAGAGSSGAAGAAEAGAKGVAGAGEVADKGGDKGNKKCGAKKGGAK